MDKRELQKLLSQPYRQENWKEIVQFVFPNVSILSTPKEFPINNDKIKKFCQIGNVRLNDGKNLALFELILGDSVNLLRNRVELNNEISKYIDQEQIHGVLSVFEQGGGDYRFTFSARSTEFDEEESDFIQKKTDTKRFTYVLGKNESCKTPADRFYKLSEKKSVADISAIQHAFSVEELSKEFFDKYKKQFDKFWTYINSNKDYKSIFFGDDREKSIRDFTKKLLGRIVFLHFLQKKGWMGCAAGTSKWEDGDKQFMQNLFEAFEDKEHFHSKCLAELFYNTLNNKRSDDLFVCEGLSGSLNKTKIPYLNGGLFDSDEDESHKIDFPMKYFEELLEFFGQYNFTIDENDPNDHEVGIDPEMLGHIFENLLEDNKDKGAFYTPKVIVQYMCQESLIEYILTKLNSNKIIGIKDAVEDLLRHRLAEKCSDLDLVEPIAQTLYDVKVCDPAIGSGAFPMGILNAIYQVVEELYWIQPDSVAKVWKISNTEWQPHVVKQNIIQHSIYGVDLESGAVDIARLRFWLALVVDEIEPLPLPNLDYKIMQGNSLLESFEGIDLSEIGDAAAYENILDEKNQIDLFTGEVKSSAKVSSIEFEDVKALMNEYFNAYDHDHKKDLHKRIDDQVLNHIRFTLSQHKNELVKRSKQLEKKLKSNEAAVGTWQQKEKIRTSSREAKALAKINEELEKYAQKEMNLGKLSNSNERPFFLWHLFFREIFETGKFDIVIGNPPYGVSIKGDYRNVVLSELGKVPDYEIYYYFIELSKKLLSSDGILSYIIPNTFLFNTFAAKYRLSLLEDWDCIEILDCTKFSIFASATVRNTINLWAFKQGDKIGYRNTQKPKSFVELVSNEREYITAQDITVLNQNWALAFQLNPEVIQLVTKIKKNGLDLITYFPDLSQGLIAYDKYTGQDKSIIESRAYHYDSYEKEGLKKWMLGRDVTRYAAKWNGEKYIDYCDGIANPRDPKFFVGNRILVREITNPSIYAAFTNEELYNDPSLLIIKDNENEDLVYVTAILNSKLATFFHFNYSPKATKGDFPKILVKDLKEFPIPEGFNEEESVKQVIQNITESISKGEDAQRFEKLLDTWVYRLYNLSYDEVFIIDDKFELAKSDYESFDISKSI